MSQVYRRITTDASTGEVLQDVNPHTLAPQALKAVLPGTIPRIIKTDYHYHKLDTPAVKQPKKNTTTHVWVLGDPRGHCKSVLKGLRGVHLDLTDPGDMSKKNLRSFASMIKANVVLLVPPREAITSKQQHSRLQTMLNVLEIQSKKPQGHFCLLNSPDSPVWKSDPITKLEQAFPPTYVRWCGLGIQDAETKLSISKLYKLVSNIPWSKPLDKCCGNAKHCNGKVSSSVYTLFYDQFLRETVSQIRDPTRDTL